MGKALNAMKRLGITILLLTSLACNASEIDVLTQFIKYDFEWFRLNSDSYKKISPLVAWEEEPGWDEIIITSDYKIKSTPEGVEVTYTEHGTCPSNVSSKAQKNKKY